MKKFIQRTLLFTFVVAVLDFGFGIICNYLQTNAKSGGMGKRSYIVHKMNEDIIMFGSSRMEHHYNPQIISDSTHLSCYNLGENGMGILYSYPLLKITLERYKPKIIIYDITGFDFEADDNSKHVALLKPFYKYKSVKEVICNISETEKYKMCSSLYKYNSLFVRLIGSNIRENATHINGYFPIEGHMMYDISKSDETIHNLDSLKLFYFEKFISLCEQKEVSLIFCLSPKYKVPNNYRMIPVMNIINKHNVELWDNYTNVDFVGNKDLFADQSHLNEEGSNMYTSMIASRLKQLIASNNDDI